MLRVFTYLLVLRECVCVCVGGDAGFGMAHWTREDLPYYYTLLDHFLIGDQYHQATFTETNPNRLHLYVPSALS